MKGILILERIKECDVEDYTCPLWNKDKLMCQYRFNTKSTGGCPLKPMPQKKEYTEDEKENCNIANSISVFTKKGYNDCIDEITGEKRMKIRLTPMLPSFLKQKIVDEIIDEITVFMYELHEKYDSELIEEAFTKVDNEIDELEGEESGE